MDSEQKLWCAVIELAIKDKDHRWFFQPNRDFAAVCGLAGVDSDWLRDTVRRSGILNRTRKKTAIASAARA